MLGRRRKIEYCRLVSSSPNSAQCMALLHNFHLVEVKLGIRVLSSSSRFRMLSILYNPVSIPTCPSEILRAKRTNYDEVSLASLIACSPTAFYVRVLSMFLPALAKILSGVFVSSRSHVPLLLYSLTTTSGFPKCYLRLNRMAITRPPECCSNGCS